MNLIYSRDSHISASLRAPHNIFFGKITSIESTFNFGLKPRTLLWIINIIIHGKRLCNSVFWVGSDGSEIEHGRDGHG
jgi:hypothetical protein